MVSSSLVEYIKKYSSQYSREYLRSYLIGQGYSTSDVDCAFSIAIEKKKFSLKTFAIILGVVIVLLLVIYVGVDYVSRSEVGLNILVTPLLSEIERENSQVITITVYSDSSDTLSGTIFVNVLDPQNNALFSKDFLISFTRQEDYGVEIGLGKDSPLGKYKTTASLLVGKKKLEKEAFFVVKEKSVERPKPAITQIPTSKCPISCDDFDPCTTDACVNGVCISTKKVPCCGNNICEDYLDENILNCPDDCRAPKTKTIFEIKQDAISLANSNPTIAANTCLQLSDPDPCIFELYDLTKNQDFCKAIIDFSLQSNCYLSHALRNKDFSVCNLIREEYSQRNCFSMKQIHEMSLVSR